jgi:hypothetical protein
MEELKNCIRKYQRIDNELHELNKTVYSLREDRRIVEIEMTDVMKTPQFSTINTFKLEDGSNIRIQRPQNWSKPWSMSRRDLAMYVDEYFKSTQQPSAKQCVEFITQMKERTLVSNDFAFTRNLSKED